MINNTDDQNLPWKRVWITGAGRGIGAALTKLFCQKGLTVYVSSRTEQDLMTLKQEMNDCPGEIISLPLDVRDQEQINRLVETWKKENNFPDLVILNAGTHDPFPAQEFSAERCEKLFQLNFFGTLKCLDPVLKYYLENVHSTKNVGQIAVMASLAGYRGLPDVSAYCATKAALIRLCESLKLDLMGSHVKLQVINPGFVRTPLTDENDFDMPCLMEPEDAALAILKGLQSNRFEIAFPTRFVAVLKFLRLLPYSIYFWLIEKAVKKNNKIKEKSV